MQKEGVVAAVYTKSHGEEDEEAGNGMNPVCNDHGLSLGKN